MTLFVKRPARDFFDTNLQRTFDKFYDDFFSDFSPFEQLGKANYPKCNIIDKNNELVVQAAIPGLNKDDVELEVDDKERTITLRSSKASSEKPHEDDDYVRREIKFSSFSRSFLVKDENLDLVSIDATHENGILELKIPKKEKEEVEPRKIKIH
jgi:HSP20 family protein